MQRVLDVQSVLFDHELLDDEAEVFESIAVTFPTSAHLNEIHEYGCGEIIQVEDGWNIDIRQPSRSIFLECGERVYPKTLCFDPKWENGFCYCYFEKTEDIEIDLQVVLKHASWIF